MRFGEKILTFCEVIKIVFDRYTFCSIIVHTVAESGDNPAGTDWLLFKQVALALTALLQPLQVVIPKQTILPVYKL